MTTDAARALDSHGDHPDTGQHLHGRIEVTEARDRLDAPDLPLTLTVAFTPDQLALLAHHVAALLRDGRDDGFLDVGGAAAFLGGCSRKAVYHLVERGRIRSHRVGGRLLFDPAELRADVERGD